MGKGMKWVTVGNMLLPVKEKEPTPAQDLIAALKEPALEPQAQPELTNLQIPEDPRPNHAHPEKSESTAFRDARDQLRQEHAEVELAELKQRVEDYNPQIVGRDGKLAHAFIAKLKAVLARNKADGSINYLETLRIRKKMIEGFEREKELGGRFSANRFNQ